MSEWISIKDGLPIPFVKVLVTNGYYREISYFSNISKKWYQSASVEPISNLTHWMPLPNPPKES